jgi:hypothetical protein
MYKVVVYAIAKDAKPGKYVMKVDHAETVSCTGARGSLFTVFRGYVAHPGTLGGIPF